MAVNDTEITRWSTTQADNAPSDDDRIQDDFAASIRNIKGVYRNDESRNKGWLKSNPFSGINPVSGTPGLYIITCTGRWDAYLQRNRKLKFYNPSTQEALYAHVIPGGNFTGTTVAYDAASDTTTATIRIFGNFTTNFSRVAFGVDNGAPAVFPFDGVSGMYKHGGTDPGSSADAPVDVDITFPARQASDTVDNFDSPTILLPRNIFTTEQRSTDNTNRKFCVDAFVKVTASRTNSSNTNCTRIDKVYKLTHSGFTVTIGGNPAYGQGATSNWSGYYVLLEYSVVYAAQHVPVDSQTGRLGFLYPGGA